MSRSKKILELALTTAAAALSDLDKDDKSISVETSDIPVETASDMQYVKSSTVENSVVHEANEHLDNQSSGLLESEFNTLELVGNELVVFDSQKTEVSRVQVELVCSSSENETDNFTTTRPTFVPMYTVNNDDQDLLNSSIFDHSITSDLDVESNLVLHEDQDTTEDVNILEDRPINNSALINDVLFNDVGLMEPTVVDINTLAVSRKRKKKALSLSERKKVKAENLKAQHCLQPPCNNTCKKQCLLKINEERRKAINQMFWDLESCENRRYFIFNTCERDGVKRRTKDGSLEDDLQFRRNKTIKYFLTDFGDKKQEVCKVFFLTTLGFKKTNDKFVNTVLSVEKGKISPNMSMRGRQPAVNKGPHEIIIKHIESFNPTVAHYRREHAPNTRYLPSDINISFMHSDFITKNPQFKNQVSYELYRRILRSLKISFTRLGHEECETCESFKLHGHTKDNIEEGCEICSSWSKHDVLVRDSRKMYKAFSENAQSSSSDEVVVFSADLEKVIMIPRLEMFKSIIFAPRLTAFNQTFAPVGVKSKLKPVAVLWHSAIRGRNQEDLVSAYYAFLKCYRDTKKIVLWLDNCSAQNKNWCLLSFFVRVVNSPEFALTELEVFYFEPGHTFMSADSIHHQVEQSLKVQKKTYDFDDFCKAVGNACKGNIEVVKMETTNFFEWTSFKSEQKMKNMKERVYLANIVQLKAVRGELSIHYKLSYEESEEYKVLDFLQPKIRKKGVFPVPKTVSKAQGFPQERKAKLLEALKGIIPENRKRFWEELPSD